MKNLIILTIILFTVQFLASISAQTEQKPELVVQTGHLGTVKSAIFSPDGKLIASNGQGGIILWDSLTGREIRRIQGVFSAIDFSPDSKSIVAAEFTDEFLEDEEMDKKTNFSIEIFDVSNSELLKKFPTHRQRINSVKFSHDGKFILTASDDKSAKLWDAATGNLKLNFIGHKSAVSCAVFSPDNNFIAASGSETHLIDEPQIEADSRVIIWNAKNGKEVRIINHKDEGKVYFQGIGFVQFSPDGKFLVTSAKQSRIFTGDTYTIRVWNWETGEKIYSFDGHGAVSFSPDGKYILADIATKLDKNGNRELDKDGYELTNEDSQKTMLNGVKLIELQSGRIVSRFASYASLSRIGSLSFSVDGRYALVATETIYSGGTGVGDYGENLLRIYDAIFGRAIYELGQKLQQVKQLSLSKDGKIALAGDYVWNLEKGELVKLENFSPNNLEREFASELPRRILSNDGKMVAESLDIFEPDNNDFGIQIWNTESGQEINKLKADQWKSAEFTADNQFILGESPNDVCLWRISDAKEIWCHDYESWQATYTLSFVADGRRFSVISDDTKTVFIRINTETLIAVNLATGDEIWRKSIEMSPLPGIFLSNKYIIVPTDNYRSGGEVEFLTFVDIKTHKEVFKVETDSNTYSTNNQNVLIAYQESKKQQVFIDKNTGKVIAALPKDLKVYDSRSEFSVYSSRLGLSSDTKRFLAVYGDEVRLYDLTSSKVLRTFKGHNGDVSRVMFFQNDSFVISSSLDGTTRIWDAKTGNEICKLISFDNETWIVATPEGRFDTNKLENPRGLHWIMPDAPFTPLSFEVFMRDYYEPNLLPRLLKCTEAGNCDKDTDSLPREFKPVRNLTELNRTQPLVRIADVKATAVDEVQVTVEAEDAVSEYQRDKQNKPLRSGAFDLRLFRDGQLVGYAPDGDGAVGLDKNGKFTKTFNVRLPKNRDEKDLKFNFTAYAFNSDLVKSETAQKTYIPPKPLPKAKGSAFIVTIGVNANETDSLRLNFAANDARRLQEELAKNLPKDRYEKIVQISLVSDFAENGKLAENNATKAKIKAVLDRLAGKTVADDVLKDVPNAASLKKVQPEDLVLIAFSGHGYADREGIFYLIPYDIGKSADAGLAGVLGKSVSSNELSLWLRDIDAGEMMMIVDACHSAAAVQGKDFKPGPMGSRGLGQLSYDKGMRILTATQADNVALELGNLQHGLLTYSLITNGLECGLADFQPKDNKLFSNEWLSFAVKDVPMLYEKAFKGELKKCEKASKGILNERLLVNGKSGVYILDGRKSNLNLQQPTLFDFSRRDRQFELLDVILR